LNILERRDTHDARLSQVNNIHCPPRGILTLELSSRITLRIGARIGVVNLKKIRGSASLEIEIKKLRIWSRLETGKTEWGEEKVIQAIYGRRERSECRE